MPVPSTKSGSLTLGLTLDDCAPGGAAGVAKPAASSRVVVL
jgi:hypothetical protein